MSLGERLIELRKGKHLSQEEVADKLNVTRQTISKWELDQSTPDFDKIKPLCDLYEISTDELINGIKKESNNIDSKDDEVFKARKRASGIATGVLLYFLAVVWIMISVAGFGYNPIIAAGIFLILCGVATSIIIYTQLTYKKSVSKKEKKEKELYKQIQEIIAVFTVLVYLTISFLTGAWHITWLIWIVYALVMAIVRLVLSLRGEYYE